MADPSVTPILAEYDKHLPLYTEFASHLCHLINELLNTERIRIHSIASRIKEKQKLTEKINRSPGKYTQLSDITDIAGVRVITYFSDEVDRVRKIVEQEFDIDHVNSIDLRSTQDPDRFGYVSLHYILSFGAPRLRLPEYRRFAGLKAEVQIRSILQHAWAEIEHDLVYKGGAEIPRDVRRDFSQLAGVLELVDQEFVRLRDTVRSYKRSLELAEFLRAAEPALRESRQRLKEHLADILSTLSPRERRVLQLRFGLEDGRTRTLEEVAREFGLSARTVKRNEIMALRKLRHLPRRPSPSDLSS